MAGFLKIEVLKSTDPIATQNAQGVAHISETDGGCAVTLRSFIGSGENEIIEFKGDAGRIAIFDCNFGLYGDLWIASRAQFLVENIETLQLKVFLPPAAGSRDKKLSVIVNGETVGQPASLSRGKVQEIAIGLDDRNLEATLELISEYPEDVGSADQRLLGFILSEYSVENGVWEAAKELVE